SGGEASLAEEERLGPLGARVDFAGELAAERGSPHRPERIAVDDPVVRVRRAGDPERRGDQWAVAGADSGREPANQQERRRQREVECAGELDRGVECKSTEGHPELDETEARAG